MNRLTALIHGDSGTGKSWLADTAPGPRLVLDAELRSAFTPSHKILWDPRTDFPADLTEDDTVVVKVRSFQDLEVTYQRIQAGHPFNSIIIDSLTEVQDRLVDAIAGTQQMQMQDWGKLLRDLASYVRRFRDLRDHPTHPLLAFIAIAGTKTFDGKERPLLQGQIKDKIPYWFDLVGYVLPYMDEGVVRRSLVVQPYVGNYEAKDNTGLITAHYGPTVPEPNITDIIRALNASGTEEKENSNA